MMNLCPILTIILSSGCRIKLGRVHRNFRGFRGKSLDWLRSFLSNRSQFVEINQQRSCSLDINIGVPQGSTLGPLLFILYINDLNKSLTMLKSIHFADDTTLYLDINPSNNHTSMINSELAQVEGCVIRKMNGF